MYARRVATASIATTRAGIDCCAQAPHGVLFLLAQQTGLLASTIFPGNQNAATAAMGDGTGIATIREHAGGLGGHAKAKLRSKRLALAVSLQLALIIAKKMNRSPCGDDTITQALVLLRKGGVANHVAKPNYTLY